MRMLCCSWVVSRESWVLSKWSGRLLMMATQVRKEKEVQTKDRVSYPKHCLVGLLRGAPMFVSSHPNMVTGT